MEHKTKNIFKELYAKGIRKIHSEWQAGGDDGSVTCVDLFPKSMAVTGGLMDQIQSIAWSVYDKEFGGACAGEFDASGFVNIDLHKDGTYKANCSNDYAETKYDEKTEETIDVDSTTEKFEDIELVEEILSQ